MSNMGWICPRCQKAHAPFVQSCQCEALPDLIGKPLPTPNVPVYPWGPLGPGQLEPPLVWSTTPMPGCGCTGPCMNVACPHLPKITCLSNFVVGDGLARTSGGCLPS